MQEITCTHNKTFLIYAEKIDNKDLLVIDINIKEYSHLNSMVRTGWHDIRFPKNTLINDKLYLDEDLKNEVVHMLEIFIEQGRINHMQMQKTERGFDYVDLKDIAGQTISMQNSSAATYDAVWFGSSINAAMIKKENGEDFIFPDGSILIKDRLHLNQSLARQLVKAINVEWNRHMLDRKLAKKDNNNKKSKL